MTKAELQAAQFLHGVVHGAYDHEGTIGDDTARALRMAARDAFFALTGRLPSSVHVCELSTDNPASWTKVAAREASR